jgi:hypothetical protein
MLEHTFYLFIQLVIDMTDEEYLIWFENIPEQEFRELANLDIENERTRIREEKEKVKKGVIHYMNIIIFNKI